MLLACCAAPSSVDEPAQAERSGSNRYEFYDASRYGPELLQVVYVLADKTPGSGSLVLFPTENQINTTWIPAVRVGWEGAESLSIDFSTALPGFNATCVHLLESSDASDFLVGGCFSSAVEGGIVRARVNPDGDSDYEVEVIYSGFEIGGMRALVVDPGTPSRIWVLDHQNACILTLNLENGEVTVMVSTEDAPALKHCQGLRVYSTTPSGYSWVATTDGSMSLREEPYSGKWSEVHIYDSGGDGTIEHVAVHDYPGQRSSGLQQERAERSEAPIVG